MSLKNILSKVERELKEKKEVKDELYDAMRKATRFSKQAIFLVHKRRLKEAIKTLKDTKKLFAKLDNTPTAHKELVFTGIVDAAFQEYTEAHVFLELVQNGKFVSPKKIGVPSISYLLGLADVVGELRRRALDSLREGNVKVAEKSLEAMETIYNELTSADEVMHTVSELRRKTDIARRIIESTRGDVTIEVRRSSLEDSIKKLEKVLKTEKK